MVTGTTQWRAFGAAEKLLFRPAKQRRQLGIVQLVARLEVALIGGPGEAVPGADQLAVIAAEHPIADQWAQLDGDCALEFDGQVGNAASRIQHIRTDKGRGRADVQAGAAAPAVFAGVGGICRQRQVDKQLAKKEPAAGFAIEHQGVLADPAKAGLFGNRLLQHWGTVDKGAVTERANRLLNALGQLLNAFADQLVVIAAQGVARYVGLLRLAQALAHLRVAGQVVHAQRNDPQRAGHQLLGV